MKSLASRWRRGLVAVAAVWIGGACASDFDTRASNLVPVLRESPGANKLEESLLPFGKIGLTLKDGREVEFEASWFQYLGDMHLRLMFDGEQRMQSVVPADLQRLKLSPEEALAVATQNLRRRYGAPVARPWQGGLMQVQADAPEMVSSYFLDRDFWTEQVKASPKGIVAAVPRRGGIVFAPADDEAAMSILRFSVAALYAGHEPSRISSALYLFKDGRWSVFQPPQAR